MHMYAFRNKCLFDDCLHILEECIDFVCSIEYLWIRKYIKFIHACWIFSMPYIKVDGGISKIYHTIRLEKFASWCIKVFYMKYVWVMIYETCTWWWWFNVHKLFDITFIWKIELHIIFGNLMYEERIHIDFLPQLLVF